MPLQSTALRSIAISTLRFARMRSRRITGYELSPSSGREAMDVPRCPPHRYQTSGYTGGRWRLQKVVHISGPFGRYS